MSRTYKDVPARVKSLRMYEQGRIYHDHFCRRRESITYETENIYRFPKSETAEVTRFRDELIERGVDFTEEEYSGGVFHRETLRSIAFFARHLYDENEIERFGKTIKFVVKEKRVVNLRKESEYCTDAENYDSFTNTDKRDGLPVRCDVNPYRDHYGKTEREYFQNPIRSKLSEYRRAYNSGNGDDLDEIDDEVLYRKINYRWR